MAYVVLNKDKGLYAEIISTAWDGETMVKYRIYDKVYRTFFPNIEEAINWMNEFIDDTEEE